MWFPAPTRPLRGALSFLGQHGLVLGGLGSGIAALSCLALNRPLAWDLVFTAFALVTPSYGIDRIIDAARDEEAHPERATRYQRQRWLLIAAYVALFAAALGTAAHVGWAQAAMVAAFPLSVVVYVVPVLPARFSARRIKDIRFSKGPFIGLCWAGQVALAASWLGEGLTPATVALGLYVFLICGLSSIISDLKDEASDRLAGVPTLPVVFGRKRAVQLARAFYLLALAVSVFALAFGAWNPRALLLVAAAAAMQLACLRHVESPSADLHLMSDALFDGAFVPLVPLALVLT